jgi:hypothetical protein
MELSLSCGARTVDGASSDGTISGTGLSMMDGSRSAPSSAAGCLSLGGGVASRANGTAVCDDSALIVGASSSSSESSSATTRQS